MIESPSVGSRETELSCRLGAGAISVSVPLSDHPLDAVYAASYHFVDRCFVRIDTQAEDAVQVTLRAPDAEGDEALLALGQAFAVQLANDTVRHHVEVSTRDLRAYYTARAFYFGDAAPADIDTLLAELDAEEALDQGQGVGVPWDDDEPEAGAEDGGATS